MFIMSVGGRMAKKKKQETVEDIIDRIDNDIIALRDKFSDMEDQLAEKEIDDEDDDEFEDEDEDEE